MVTRDERDHVEVITHVYTKKNNLTEMELLIKKWKWALHVRDINGRTPLHVAVTHGCLEMVKFLIKKGADVSAPDCGNDTPLHDAVFHANTRGSLDIMQYLIKSGADLDARNRDCNSALHIAVLFADSYRDIGVAIPLLKGGADINLINGDGDTALHIANRRRYSSLEECLIKAGADPNIKNKKGETCLNTKVY
ncbi:hypothetical protein TNCT_55291 [Trichonephila clavata]|uniref:Ankyrin repeat protein n=1 Tax=Trichonephila clavata TaxID=2740835 RepID=A0A8X6LEU6_TRICU|nr:hypothetical protein TNCT_55291 [Trichonephila clavata]